MAKPVRPVPRCPMSDLPADTCACASCRPDLAGPELPDPLPVAYAGSWLVAQYPGTCGCGCGTRYAAGADIVCADVNGGRPRDKTWCLVEHTRSTIEGGH